MTHYTEVPLSTFRTLATWNESPTDAGPDMLAQGDYSGSNVRIIHESAIDEIQTDELQSDHYILGCFNAWFLAEHTSLSQDIIEALQSGEKFEAIGQHIIDNNEVEAIQEAYAGTDGYGHHFSHYDHSEEKLAGGWILFRTN